MSNLMGDALQCPLEQDSMDGVEDHEWVINELWLIYLVLLISK